MRLLLHACCAPCSVQCVEALAGEGLKPDLFWYNPNIHPYTEYRARRDCLENFAKSEKLAYIPEDEYGLRSFIKGAAALGEDLGGPAGGAPAGGAGKSRCGYCYRIRLEKAALFAAENAYGAFSTTLLISPYQNHDLIRETGEALAGDFGVAFLYRDFRPGFREGQRRAREAGFYMQKYCGCIYSEEERYLGSGKARGKRDARE